MSSKPKIKKPINTSKDNFEKWKDVELFKIQSAISGMQHPHWYADIRNNYITWFDEKPEFDFVMSLINDITEMFKQLEIECKKWKYDDFTTLKLEDPYIALIPRLAHCKDEIDVFKANTQWAILRPWGEHVIKIHQTIQEDIAK